MLLFGFFHFAILYVGRPKYSPILLWGGGSNSSIICPPQPESSHEGLYSLCLGKPMFWDRSVSDVQEVLFLTVLEWMTQLFWTADLITSSMTPGTTAECMCVCVCLFLSISLALGCVFVCVCESMHACLCAYLLLRVFLKTEIYTLVVCGRTYCSRCTCTLMEAQCTHNSCVGRARPEYLAVCGKSQHATVWTCTGKLQLGSVLGRSTNRSRSNPIRKADHGLAKPAFF